MAIEIEHTQRVARPPAEVFAFVADLDGWPRWLIASGIVAVHREGPRVGTMPAAGERMTIEQRAAGRAGTFEVTVTAFEPGTRLALDGKDGDGVRIAIEAVVAPATAESPTRASPSAAAAEASASSPPPAESAAVSDLAWSFRIDLPFRYRIFEGMAEPQVRRAAMLDLEALRVRLESGASD